MSRSPRTRDPATSFPAARIRAGGDLALPFHDLLRPDEQRRVVDALASALARPRQ